MRLYYRQEDDGRDCGKVYPLTRHIARSPAVATATLTALVAGPTEAERELGWRSAFSAETARLVRRIRIDQGTAYVDLADLRGALASATSSCGAAELLAQMDATLRQFPTIQRTVYAIEGDPRAFYDWLGLPCDSRYDHCRREPFHFQ